MLYHLGWVRRTAWVVVIVLCCSFAASGQDGSAGWDMRVCADPNDLPYSNKAKEGFENRIAEIVADQLGADLSYVWYPRRRKFVQQMLRAGHCDLVMGVSDSSSKMLTTLAYYRSSYVFVYPEDAGLDITSFDDPELQQLRIGVQMGGGLLPPNKALANRGMTENLEGFPIVGDYDEDQPLAPIIKAVANGDVDIAVAWGPIAGYFAQQQDVPLKIVPVSPQFEPPFLPMVFSIAIGVRHGDRDFARLLNRAVVERWDDIQAVLNDYGIPLQPLAQPTLSLQEDGA